MPAVSETIVREYFELQGFFVRQQRKFISPLRGDDDEIDFLVVNPRQASGGGELPFVLGPTDLARIARAVVVVKGWHTDTFSTSLLTHAPEIFRFVEPAASKQATKSFGGDGPVTKILVVPALPAGAEGKRASIELLRARGIDAVIPFQTMLRGLIDQVEVNRNYQKSDLLQVIRILKNYDFFRGRQLELFRPGGTRQRKSGAKD